LVAFYPEWLKPAQCELTIVFGPPGSGKTTYAIQHAGDEGIVIDVDMIRSQLSGLPIYASGGEWLTPAVRKRNSLLGALSKSISTQKVWFVTTGSGPMRRRWWEEKLSPKSCIVMDTPVDICMKRVREDPRRDGVRSAHLKAISEWT
jgi:adenylate kinase family enzyme